MKRKLVLYLKIMRRNFLIIVVAASFCFQFCSHPENPAPKELISPDSMVSLLVDIHVAEAAANVTRLNDVMRFSASDLYPGIFKTHHTDSIAFRKSVEYYLANPKKFDKIYEQVLNELSRRESETQTK